MAVESNYPRQEASGTPRSNSQIFLYFGAITFLYWMVVPHQGFVDIPIAFVLKNRFHLDANATSWFRMGVAIPVFGGLFVGLVRDKWNPLGLRDRGYFQIFGLLTAGVFFALIFTPDTYWSLFVGVFVAMLVFRFVAAAYQGLIALIGQEDLMSGRLSTLWNFVSYIPVMIGFFVGAILNDLPKAYIFTGAAIVMLLIAAFGLWRPASVFEGTYSRPMARTAHLKEDLL